MKTRNVTRRAVSVLFCLLLLCALVPLVYASGGDSVIAGAEMKVGSDRVQVIYNAAVDAVAVAALYDGSTGRMRAVGTENAYAGSGTFPIYLPEERQEGDELRVFLLDRNSSAPLAKCWTEDENGEPDFVKEGDTITFGHYEQDNNLNNGAEDVVWRVLAAEGGKALLISEKALDSQQYHTRWTHVTWEDCTLRTWLNHEFYDAAFDAGEKERIAEAVVTAEDNPTTGTEAGSGTIDRVFLLSIGEVNRYFSSDSYEDKNGNGLWYKDRMCAPTAYAVSRGCWQSFYWTLNGEYTCDWWLRSPGSNLSYAAYVENNGSLYDDGINVGSDFLAVRPALWINLNP